MVKSRRELQKERKEQRDEEERQAARKQREEVAAARKAAQQVVREQLKAQRDLVRSEARKAEAQASGDLLWGILSSVSCSDCCGGVRSVAGCAWRTVAHCGALWRTVAHRGAPWGWTWTRGCCFRGARRSKAMLVA